MEILKLIYPENVKSHEELRVEIWEKYLSAGKNVPRMLLIFGKPLHFFGRFQSVLMPNLIRLFNFQPEKLSSSNLAQRDFGDLFYYLSSYVFHFILL